MASSQPLISAVKSAVIRVASVTNAKRFFTDVVGLQPIGETTMLADKARRLWGLPEREILCVRLARPGESFGMVDLVEIPGATAVTIRDRNRPLDFGWFTLNFRTRDIERAVAAAEAIGARALNTPKSYEAGGQAIREVLIELPSGERCTLLEVGGAKPEASLFAESIATAGTIVPSLDKALAFYRDALGMNVAVSIDQQGEPFAGMMGAPSATRVQMALLTSGTWTGKLEFLELGLPAGYDQQDATPNADGLRLGYWMMSVMTPDMDVLQAACRHSSVPIIRGPATIDRPCFGRVKAMIIRGPGGELLECLAPASGVAPGRRS